MLFSPRATFESVAAYPKWLDVLILTIVVGCLSWTLFLWSPIGSQAFVDNMIAQAERSASASGGNAAQATENIQRMFPVIRLVTVCVIPIIAPIFVAVIAGLLYGIFAAILGGGASYKQVFAVVVHAGVVSMIGQVVVLALNYARQTMTSATTLGVFAPMLPEDSFVFKLLSTIDLVWIWYLVILAMGLAVLYRRKTATVATSFLSLYFVIAVIIAFFKRGA
jgi:Yip1 domain